MKNIRKCLRLSVGVLLLLVFLMPVGGKVEAQDEGTDMIYRLADISLVYPVRDTGKQWRITQGYNTYYHGGNDNNRADLMALDFAEVDGSPVGREVVAAADGIVWSKSDCTIVLRHGNLYTSYVHIQADANLSLDEEVVSGQTVGTMKLCWIASGAHVHFMLNKWVGAGNPVREFPFGSNWEALPFEDVCGQSFPFLEDGSANQYNNTNITPCENSDRTPPSIFITSAPATGQWYGSGQVISWLVSDEVDGSGVRGYKYSWNRTPPVGSEQSGVQGSANLSSAGQGQHTLYIQAWDNTGNPSAVVGSGWWGYDTLPPANPTFVSPHCPAVNNLWQNTCSDTNFTWSGAVDTGSGVKDYHLYWGPFSNGMPDLWTTAAAYDPLPISNGDVYYLNMSTRDNLNYVAKPATLFVLKYDITAPTVALAINGGAPAAGQVNVILNIDANDSASGPHQMRFSNNGQYWSAWQPYQASTGWVIPALDGDEVSVYAEVRDRAGNVGQAADAIHLELSQDLPNSASYRLCARSVNLAGGYSNTSSYQLFSVLGEAGLGSLENSGYQHEAGFLAGFEDCWLPPGSTETYTMTQSVVASGGWLRSSGSYRVGDTLGQPLASGAVMMQSSSYQLTGGFWAAITGTVPLPPREQDPWYFTDPLPTPAPVPDPTPQPGTFGILLNEGAAYTNQRSVTVHAWAPDVTQMQLGNTAEVGSGWHSYQVTTTWMLSTSTNNLNPIPVYAWFRDTRGEIFGTYIDLIYYDSEGPEGSLTILEGDGEFTANLFLWLVAYDNLSGVEWMRVSEDPGMAGVEWIPFTNSLEWPLIDPGRLLYAQLRDRAGNLSPIYDSNGNLYATERKIYLPLVRR